MDVLDWLSSYNETVISLPDMTNKRVIFYYKNVKCKVRMPSESNRYHVASITTDPYPLFLDSLNLKVSKYNPFI